MSGERYIFTYEELEATFPWFATITVTIKDTPGFTLAGASTVLITRSGPERAVADNAI